MTMKAKISLWKYATIEVPYDAPGLLSFEASEQCAGINDEAPERNAHIAIKAVYDFGGGPMTITVDIHEGGDLGGFFGEGKVSVSYNGTTHRLTEEQWPSVHVGPETLADWVAEMRAFVTENFGGFYEYPANEEEEEESKEG